ncbi:ThiF family adenylyltransferase [Vibrio rotiferianus]|uniref:ThiF family adenylyltransferase n=1 Tax=Vibrio rotiferianus TaxID=190895 RepID=UPI00406A22CB
MIDVQSMVEDEFLAWGFRYTPIQESYPIKPAFSHVFQTHKGDFQVLIPVDDFTFLKLPKPQLISLPKAFEDVRLPHLEGNRTICLFDDATKNIDPLNPRALISACLDQLGKIIQGWVDGANYQDIAVEFSSYWEPERLCFLLSEEKNSKLYAFNRETLSGKCVTEYAIAANENQISLWSNKRNIISDTALPNELCKVINIHVNGSFFIPFKHKWPLTSLGEVFGWLEKVDSRASSSLFDKLRNDAKEQSTFMILLSANTIHVGLKLTLAPMGKAALGVGAPRKKKINMRFTLSALTKKHCVTSFQKFLINNATQDYVFERNTQEVVNTLKNKRVCVIGCGTIGGYLAYGLTQIGAGTGRGELALYDEDIVKTGNLGRHILGVQYLGEQKSDSLVHFITKQTLIDNVSAHNNFKKVDIDKGWDVIVDATGEQGFSLQLATWYREEICSRNKSTTLLIHSWISGFGHQVKSLLDDGSGACFACLFDYSPPSRKDRYPSFGSKNRPDPSIAFKRTCGESHLPFGSEVSMAAASLALRLIKQTEPRKANYLQKSISALPIEYPEKILTKMGGCPVCQS